VLDADRWAEYDQLLAKKKTGLSHREERRLEDLRREADILMLRKGYAAVLLKRRGYAVAALSLNSDLRLKSRAIWVEAGWHPPE
jgi:hypothetical protein